MLVYQVSLALLENLEKEYVPFSVAFLFAFNNFSKQLIDFLPNDNHHAVKSV